MKFSLQWKVFKINISWRDTYPLWLSNFEWPHSRHYYRLAHKNMKILRTRFASHSQRGKAWRKCIFHQCKSDQTLPTNKLSMKLTRLSRSQQSFLCKSDWVFCNWRQGFSVTCQMIQCQARFCLIVSCQMISWNRWTSSPRTCTKDGGRTATKWRDI